MRLTLRAMLAHLDGHLKPPEGEIIAKKIEESEFATTLVHRIRDVLHRIRLAAPKLDGRGMGVDANTVAEYLDNTMPGERVPDFEKVCLESDVHLAEVAASHQILTLVLSEKAEFEPALRERMYGVIHQPPVTRATPPAPAPSVAVKTAAAAPPPVSVPSASMPPAVPASQAAAAAPAVAVSAITIPDADAETKPKVEIPEYLREPPKKKQQFSYAAAAIIFLFVGLAAYVAIDPARARKQLMTLLGKAPPETLVVDKTPAPVVPVVVPSAPEVPAPQAPTEPVNTVPMNTVPMPPAPTTPPAIETPATTPATTVPPTTPTTPAPPLTQPDSVKPVVSTPATPTSPTPLPATGNAPTPPERTIPAPPPAAPPKSVPVGVNPSVVPATALPMPPMPIPAAPVVPQSLVMGKVNAQGALIVKRNEDQSPQWQRIAGEAPISANDQLLALPTYRSTLGLNDGLGVELWGGSLAQLVPADQAGVSGLYVHYGRVLLAANGKAGLSVRFGAGGRQGLITLLTANTAVAVEARPVYQDGVDPLAATATIAVDVFVQQGEMRWTNFTDQQTVTVKGPGRMPVAIGEAPPARGPPAWLTSDDRTEAEKLASPEVEKGAPVDRALTLALKELSDDRRVEVRLLAVRCLVHLGEYEALISALRDENQAKNWDSQVDALREAIWMNPAVAARVKQVWEHLRGPAKGGEMFRMLWGYTIEQLRTGDAEKLIKTLDHEDLDHRVLAFWNLRRIAAGKTLSYRPEHAAPKRRPNILKWEQLYDSGQLLPKP